MLRADAGVGTAALGWLVKISLSVAKGQLTVMVDGDIVFELADKLAETLSSALTPWRDLRVDLSKVNFIDSSGIWVLLRAHQQATTANGSITLVAPVPAVRRTLELIGLTGLVPIIDR